MCSLSTTSSIKQLSYTQLLLNNQFKPNLQLIQIPQSSVFDNGDKSEGERQHWNRVGVSSFNAVEMVKVVVFKRVVACCKMGSGWLQQ